MDTYIKDINKKNFSQNDRRRKRKKRKSEREREREGERERIKEEEPGKDGKYTQLQRQTGLYTALI